MVFSSISFLFYFLPAFLVSYLLCPRAWKNGVLLLFSLFFYGWGEPVFISVLVMSILVNYGLGLAVDAAGTGRRALLAISIALNLCVLAVCKYLDFLIDLLNRGMGWGGQDMLPPTGIHLPLGISFFTFQSISYLVDVYRKDTPAERNLVSMGTYVAMFPQLVAGPIVRFKTIVADLHEKQLSLENAYRGARLFIVGLAMKVLLADVLAVSADSVFAADPSQLHALAAWLGTLAYCFQIYFDFCGYSYMAMGLGLICGLRFPQNFNYPYISQSITEFWRRWHISLSSWFRDYVYIAMGGNRHGTLKTYRNLMLVFLLCGLWHGAAMTFVFWGFYQGLFLIIERLGMSRLLDTVWRPVRHVYVAVVVLVGWVIFRADSMSHAQALIATLFSPGAWMMDGADLSRHFGNRELLYLPIAFIASTPAFKALNNTLRNNASAGASATVAVSGACVLALFYLTIIAMSTSTYSPFIYFRF